MDSEIKSFEDGAIIEVSFNDRIDIASKDSVRETLLQTVEAAGAIVIIDLQRVPLVDSSGLSALVSGLRAARELKKDIVLTGLNQHARMVFSLTMMDKIFNIYPSVHDALDAYRQRGAQIV